MFAGLSRQRLWGAPGSVYPLGLHDAIPGESPCVTLGSTTRPAVTADAQRWAGQRRVTSRGYRTAPVGCSRVAPPALPPRSRVPRWPYSPGVVRAVTAAARPPPPTSAGARLDAQIPHRPRTTRSPRRSRRACPPTARSCSAPTRRTAGRVHRAGRHHDHRVGHRPGHRRGAEARAHRRVPEQRLPRHHPGHPGRQVRAGHVVVLGEPRARADRRHGQLLLHRHQRERQVGQPRQHQLRRPVRQGRGRAGRHGAGRRHRGAQPEVRDEASPRSR